MPLVKEDHRKHKPTLPAVHHFLVAEAKSIPVQFEVVTGFDLPDGRLTYWCLYCEEWHEGPADHRVTGTMTVTWKRQCTSDWWAREGFADHVVVYKEGKPKSWALQKHKRGFDIPPEEKRAPDRHDKFPPPRFVWPGSSEYGVDSWPGYIKTIDIIALEFCSAFPGFYRPVDRDWWDHHKDVVLFHEPRDNWPLWVYEGLRRGHLQKLRHLLERSGEWPDVEAVIKKYVG